MQQRSAILGIRNAFRMPKYVLRPIFGQDLAKSGYLLGY